MKLNAVAIIVASVMSSSAMAIEWSDFSVNPMLGMSVDGTDVTHDNRYIGQTGSAPSSSAVAPVFGAEVFYKDKYFVGTSYSFKESTSYYSSSIFNDEYNTIGLWGGYKFDNGLALKLGGAKRTIESSTEAYVYHPSGSQYVQMEEEFNVNYAMVGVGYYMDNFNVSLHYNIATSGDFAKEHNKSEYNNINMMLGYKF